MRLPNPQLAVVDISKLEDYCLNPNHRRGRDKAAGFASTLGLDVAHAEHLRDALLRAAQEHDCVPRGTIAYGERFEIRFPLTFRGRTATVCSGWFLRRGENFARLASCYVVT